MKPIYTKQELEEIAKHLGFVYVGRFEGFIGNNYDLLDDREDGLEDPASILEADKEFYANKINELKNELAYNASAPTEEQILKVIAMVKQLNIDYLLNKYQDQIDEEVAERLVEYGYTHGNCISLANTLLTLFSECKLKFVKGGSYGHQVVEYNGKVYDINGCSTIDEMKEFVAQEGHVSADSCVIQACQPLHKHGLIDIAVTKFIGEDIKRRAEQRKAIGTALHLGQRVEKSEENQFGWEDKIETDKIDRTKPIVICLPGSATITQHLSNGMCKSIEGMLGISDLAPEDKPCQIYGVYYARSFGAGVKERIYFDSKAKGEPPDMSSIPQRNQENIQAIENFAHDLVESIFKPLVQDEKGQLYERMEIAKSFRNIHFVSFCFGSVVQSAINQELRQYLQTTGLDLESIEKLESQICVLQTAPIASETKTGQTTMNFISLNDFDTYKRPIQAKAIEGFSSQENQNIVGGVVRSPNNNPTIYVKEFTTTKQDEEHNGMFYLHFLDKWSSGKYDATYEEKVGGILPLCTAVCLRRAMQNAVSNAGSSKYVPLRSDDVAKPCAKYIDWANHNPQEIPQTLLDIYNKHVNYSTTNLIETLKL